MNKKEYNKRMSQYRKQKQEKEQQEDITPEDVQKMQQQAEQLMTDEEKAILNGEDEEPTNKFSSYADMKKDDLSHTPELRDFIQTEEHIRLGTKARIPVPIDFNGTTLKVYVRALSGKELKSITVNSKDDFESNRKAVKLACMDSHGNPYTDEELDMIGFAREQIILDAIQVASGQNSEYTQEALQEKMVNNFLQKTQPN